MSDVKQKARAELLDPYTGKPLSEVDILTSAETIFYSNKNPILEKVGDIEVGTVFNKYPLDKIIDNLLYKYTKPSITSISTNNTDFPNVITENIEILKQNKSTIGEFNLTGTFVAGTQTTVTAYLKIYYPNSTVHSVSAEMNVEPGKAYASHFNVPSINTSAIIEFSVSDGKNIVIGPTLIYSFVDPIFIGFADPRLLDNNLELDITKMDEYYDYFIGLINTNSYLLERKILKSSTTKVSAIATNIKGETVMANPVILVPATWGDVSGITDINGCHILKQFSIMTGLSLKLYDDVQTIPYIVCMCKSTFDTNSKFIEGITYNFHQIFPDISDISGNGIPTMTPFVMNNPVPIDIRFSVKTYDELLQIKYPYVGLISYVEEIHTYFSYGENGWLPTSTRVVLITDNTILTSDFCGWDDVAINSKTGEVFRKRYNNIWELWGVLGDGTNRELRYSGKYNAFEEYTLNDVVYYNGSSYVCTSNNIVIGETPEEDGVNWDILCKGYDGPYVQYVDKDTNEPLT